MRAEEYPHPSSHAVSAVMRGNRKADTKPEVLLRSELHHRGIRFRKNALLRLGSTAVRPDIIFPRQRVAVFVDGCFWHRCPEHGVQPRSNPSYWQWKLDRNVDRDARANDALENAGWSVLRIWEHVNVADAAQSVLATLTGISGIRHTGKSVRQKLRPLEDQRLTLSHHELLNAGVVERARDIGAS